MVKLSNYPNGEHSAEFYDARERDSKAKWHYDRAGKQRGASLKKGIENDYQSELLKRGVKNASGEHLPLERKTDSMKQTPFVHDHEDPASAGTKILHGFAFRG